MAVFSRITLLAGTAARCVHAMNRRGLAMANPTATFKTTKGEFKVELFQDQLPITTSNFKDLATSGFYDGLTFHRVIKGFMCQFGRVPASRMASMARRWRTRYLTDRRRIVISRDRRPAGARTPRTRRARSRARAARRATRSTLCLMVA